MTFKTSNTTNNKLLRHLLAKITYFKALLISLGNKLQSFTLINIAQLISLNPEIGLYPELYHLNPSLVLVQWRTLPYITDRLLMERKESNQTNQITAISRDKSHLF